MDRTFPENGNSVLLVQFNLFDFYILVSLAWFGKFDKFAQIGPKKMCPECPFEYEGGLLFGQCPK